MENEIILTDKDFEQKIANGAAPILVDFWAPWCMPCRIVAPILSELAKDHAGRLTIGKLNVDENPMTAARFGITGIPTLMLFKNGRMVAQWVGAMPRPALEAALKPHLPEIV